MDVEPPLLDWLEDLAYTVTTTPADLEDRLPVIRVRRVGGGGERDNDTPVVSIQTFAAPTQSSPRAHFDLATQVEDRFNDIAIYGSQLVGGDSGKICIDSPSKESGPIELTYPNPSVRVTETIYRFIARR